MQTRVRTDMPRVRDQGGRAGLRWRQAMRFLQSAYDCVPGDVWELKPPEEGHIVLHAIKKKKKPPLGFLNNLYRFSAYTGEA